MKTTANTLAAVSAFCCIVLAQIDTVQAASFDCAKANSKVEHIICDNPEISKLDENLTRSYKASIQDEIYAKTIREEQIRWIKHRNYCESSTCLKALYETRIQELADAPKFFSKKLLREMLTDSSEKPTFNKEADKLVFMRKLVNEQKFVPPRPEQSFESSEYCQQFFKDFANGAGVEAVEPTARINDANDPRLEKWNHTCENEGSAAEDSFDSLWGIGGPPYRYYRIDIDGNPKNGKEDVFYTDFRKVEGGVIGHNGYFWIDLKRCVVAGVGIPTSSHGLEILSPNTYDLSLLVKYRGEYLAVGLSPYTPDRYEPRRDIYYDFGLMDIGPRSARHVCGKSPDFH